MYKLHLNTFMKVQDKYTSITIYYFFHNDKQDNIYELANEVCVSCENDYSFSFLFFPSILLPY